MIEIEEGIFYDPAKGWDSQEPALIDIGLRVIGDALNNKTYEPDTVLQTIELASKTVYRPLYLHIKYDSETLPESFSFICQFHYQANSTDNNWDKTKKGFQARNRKTTINVTKYNA